MSRDIKGFFDFKLTGEQEEVVEQMLDFFESDDEVFILRGYAGTGKTSLMKGIIAYLDEEDRHYELLASTGRAAKILSDKTALSAVTVHSKIYRMKEINTGNEHSSKMKIIFTLAANREPSDTIYFIDESSMLSNHRVGEGALRFGSGRLLTDLFTYAGGRKIVFIGDNIQLPPINTRFSAALNAKYLSDEMGKKVREAELHQVMRYSKESGIYQNTRKIRQSVLNGYYPPLSVKAYGLPDSTIHSNPHALIESYTDTIRRIGTDNTILLVHSNKKAAEFNQATRNWLFRQKASRLLNPGESLLVIRNNYLHNLLNGDLIYFEEKTGSLKMAGLEFIKVKIRINRAGRGANIQEVYIIKDLLTSTGRDLAYDQEEKLMKNFFARMGEVSEKIYSIMTQNLHNNSHLEEALNEVLKTFDYPVTIPPDLLESQPGKSKLKQQITEINSMYDPFLNALRVKYGYAITCHKAQGGEWDEVYIVFEPSLFYKDKEDLYRWTYTAISRAARKVHYLKNYCLY